MAETISQHQQSAFANPQPGQRPISADQVRNNDNALRVVYNAHDADPGVHLQSSILASRPAFGTAGRKWLTTDGLRLYYDTGSAWSEVDYLSKAAGGTVSGNVTFSGTLTGTLTGSVSGNAGTATALQTGRTIAMTGDVTASGVTFDGTGNISLTGAITAGAIVNDDINASAGIVDTKLATISTSGKVANSATTGTAAATGSTLVLRDANGDAAFRHLTLNGVTYVWPGADGTSGQVLQTNGSGTLSWAAPASGFVTGSGTSGNIAKFNGSAALTDSIITEASTQINIGGSLRLANNSPLYGRNAANSADVEIGRIGASNQLQIGATNASVEVAPTGSLICGTLAPGNNAFVFPTADGTNGQVLQTNGAGAVAWATPASGISGLTTGTLPKAASATSLSNSIISESGTTITIGGVITATGTGTNSFSGDIGVASGKGYYVNSTKVVGSRVAGWGWTFQNTASKTSSTAGIQNAPATIAGAAPLGPVQELESLVRAMYDAMTSHGLIGA